MPRATQSDLSVQTIDSAVQQHTTALGIATQGDRDLGLWHMLASIMDYADAYNLDMDALISDIRENRHGWRD